MAGEKDPTHSESEGSAEAMDRLGESNRILVEARMLPRDKPLTDQQTNDVRQRLKEYVARTPTPMAQIARQIGYSQPVLSEWLAGKYPGNSDKVAHALNDWMERDGRRQLAQRPKDFVSTWVADRIRTMVIQADKRTKIAVIVAPAGSGKTKVLKILCDQFRGVYLYCDQQLTPREFLRSLAEKMGRASSKATKAELQRWIVKTLTGTNRVIFLDEAHQLGAALNCVRSIYDQSQVPIVMAGTADILHHVDDRSDGRGQFARRCLFCNILEEIRNIESPDGSKSGGRDLFTMDEIKRFLEVKGMRLADDAIDLCWSLACLPNHGTLGLVETTVEIVLDLYPETEVITRKQVMVALSLSVGKIAAGSLQKTAARHAELSRAVA